MRCFVVMGFGIKTDLATGRKLNLDKSYNALIKPVVTGKGLECVRADEIRHSGSIDVPMYQQLLTADIVIADLSTANPNAFYELGLRHALRPRTTIVISEEQLCYPFDLNHILITKYTHLGENIDYFEVLRFQKLLGETIDAVLNKEVPDSPVYTFLNDLIPPSVQKKAEKVAEEVEHAIKAKEEKDEEKQDDQGETVSLVVKKAEEALHNKQYSLAKSLFNSAFLITNCNSQQKLVSSNSYLIHSLAYSTYKAKEPDEITALTEAISLLDDLDLKSTNDSETVVLAGRIEKRLFDKGQGEDHLANAILYYERAYHLLNNRYNGINLAFLYNCRVDTSLYNTEQEKIADMILANRIRLNVLKMCEKDWKKLTDKDAEAKKAILENDDDLAANQKAVENEQKFWILVNKAEANFGLGKIDEYNKAREKARVIDHEGWMMEAFEKQVSRLRNLLVKYGHLLNPPWNEAGTGDD